MIFEVNFSTIFNVTGVGYHEHLFGDRPIDGTFSFRFSSIKELINLNFLYLSILKWMLQPKTTSWFYKMHMPHVSVDNIRGYDWIWSTFDNGWSMILVRLRLGYPLSFTEGPSIGFLILTDGEHIWEFSELYIKITEDIYLEDSGIYVPLDFSSLNRDESTNEGLALNRFALSLGTGFPQLEHWTKSLLPFPPLPLPPDFLFFGNTMILNC